MTAIVLPLWTTAAAWLVLCWLAVLVDVIVKRRRARRRLRVARDQRGYSFPDWYDAGTPSLTQAALPRPKKVSL